MGTLEIGPDEGNGLRTNEEPAQSPEPEILPKGATGPLTASGKQHSKMNALKHGILAPGLTKRSEKIHYDKLAEELRGYFQVQDSFGTQLVDGLVDVIRRLNRVSVAECAETQKQLQSDEELRREAVDIETRIHSREGERGLLEYLQNPFIIDRCLELLNGWRQRVCQRGYDACFDVALMRKLYGSLRAEEMDTALQQTLKIAAITKWKKSQAQQDAEKNKLCTELIEKLEHDIEFVEHAKRVFDDMRKDSIVYEKDIRLFRSADVLDRLIRYEAHLSREFDRRWNRLERLRSLHAGHPAPPEVNIEIHNHD
jgi:hypothetical protein